MSLIETIKKSEFWNNQYENFNAASFEALEFLKENNLTLDSNIGIETGITAVVEFTSRYESLKNQRGVNVSDLKDSQYQYDPVFGEIYIIDAKKREDFEKQQAEEKIEKDKEWEEYKLKINGELKKQKEEKIKKDKEVLKSIENLTFGELMKKNKDWKYYLQTKILPIIFNTSSTIYNNFGTEIRNPQIVISGNKKSGYKIGDTYFSDDQKILDFLK